MSSSLPLTFNPSFSWQKSPTISSDFSSNLFTFANYSKPPCFSLSKSHICFTFNDTNSSNYEREETRWLREEQRWMREEQRWLRQESRWEAERESLVNEIKALQREIEELRRQGQGGNSSVANLLQVLKKEVSQIAESGSSGAPWVVEAEAEAAAAVEDAEEVVVKEVNRISEEAKVVVTISEEAKDELKKRRTLRVGTEGDQVRELQEALQKLGFYSGEEDMEFASFSSGTERAVKTWQASIGVPETGMMTSELLDMLYLEQKKEISGLKEAVNGAFVKQIPEIQENTVKDYGADGDHRVFLLGENRWEDSSRLKGRNKLGSQSQPISKNVTTKCLTCRGEGRLMCVECDGTGEPNIEPQFLEWVGEDTKCPYCEGLGYTICDLCQGKAVTAS